MKTENPVDKAADERDFEVLDNNTVVGLMRLRQTTLAAWARERGFTRPYTCLAMTGQRRGPKARLIVRMLREELGL
jgi:hypothetical protein